MIEITSVEVDALDITVTAKGDKAAGPLRIQFGEDAPYQFMTVDTAPTDSALGVYSATKTLTDANVVRPVVSGNDQHVTGRNVQVGDIKAYDPDEFYPTIAERQAEEARKAKQISGVTGRIG